ncbi:MAG: hypothetical protein WCI11_18170 [Candidatus Methylumidiphilus sp.]
MLFQYEGKPSRLLRLFKSYRGMASRLREHRSRYAGWVMMSSLVYLAAVGLALFWWDDYCAAMFWLLTACGLLFVLLAWGFSGVFQRYPSTRRSPTFRIVMGLALSVASLMSFQGLQVLWQELPASPTELIGFGYLPLAWALASLGVWLACRGIVWLRLKSQIIQEFELEFLDKLLTPLLRDLPPDSACAMACNPFTAVWSEKFSMQNIGPKYLKICDDVLLNFRVKLGPESSLVLQTLHKRVDKYKVRKNKYKGTTHRVAMVCRLQHPAMAKLNEGQIRELGQVCKGLQGKSGGYVTTVRRQLGEGKVIVVSKGKFPGNRELAAEDLPKVQNVLEAVRSLTACIAKFQAA